MEALAGANHLRDGATLQPGQVLVIPGRGAESPSPSGGAPAPSGSYTVAVGDTLWDIARRHGVSVEVLAAANRLSPTTILRPGEVLSLPAGRQERDEPRASTTALRARARMLWPSSGIITSRFGWRIHPIFGTREFHTGLDIATRWGSPVLAARAGVVRFVGWMAGYGRMVVVDHGRGLETVYSHLSAALVRPGQYVAQGEVIGRIGSTGWSTGPHLLFEVRRNGVPVDPLRYLN